MTHHPDEVIAARAARQLGLVTRAQLLRAGLSADAIDRRVRIGRLRLMHRGVYLVGPLVASHAREMAAVLACGRDAVLSYRSATTLWQLLPYAGTSAPVDVTIRHGDRGRRSGIRVHRVPSLGPDEVTTLEMIPITTPARTLLDLASVVGHRELEQALAQAERRNLTNRTKLLSLLAAHPRRPGTRLLRSLLEADAPPLLTRSEAEERVLALIRIAQLPVPEANVSIEGVEVDFFWRDERLVLEVDGFAFHSSERKFESDRRRDAQLAARGIHVMRVTWRQIMREPEAMLVRLGQALARAGGFPRQA